MTWDNLRFTLPLPARTNALTRPAVVSGKARLVKAPASKAWIKLARPHLEAIGLNLRRPPLEGPVKVEVIFWFESISDDIDGRLKSLFDVMTGIVWDDDRQVCELLVKKRILNPEAEDPVTARCEPCVHVCCWDASLDSANQHLAVRLLAAKKRKPPQRALGLQPAVYR